MGNGPNALDATSPTSRSCPRNEASISYRQYAGEPDLPSIMALVQSELSEPYVIYTYRYFLQQWPHLAFLAFAPDASISGPVGVIVCKQSIHKDISNRGYIAMLSVNKSWRKRGIARALVDRSIKAMKANGVEEVVLETEYDNAAALSLYESLGFIREKRLYRFYMNGKDAFRLVLAVPPAHLTQPSPVSPLAISPGTTAQTTAFSIRSFSNMNLASSASASATPMMHVPPRLPTLDTLQVPMSRRHAAIYRVLPAFVSMTATPFDDDEVSSR